MLLLPAGNLPVLNLLSASVAKNQHFRPYSKKTALGSKNDLQLLELSRRSLSARKVWGDQSTRAGCRSENWCFCTSRLVCLRVGDIVQTSIVWRFMGRFWCDFQRVFRMDCSFRYTRYFLFSLLGGATIFANLLSKISSPKIGGKVCAHHFV